MKTNELVHCGNNQYNFYLKPKFMWGFQESAHEGRHLPFTSSSLCVILILYERSFLRLSKRSFCSGRPQIFLAYLLVVHLTRSDDLYNIDS